MHLSRILSLVSGLSLLAISSTDAQCAPARITLIAHRDFAAAKRSLDVQLRANARSDSVLHCLGTLALEMDDHDDALDYFEKAGNQARAQADNAVALEYKPDHAEARKALGGR